MTSISSKMSAKEKQRLSWGARGRKVVPLFLLVIGLALMVFGVARGEVMVVFTKAIRICLECIGIG